MWREEKRRPTSFPFTTGRASSCWWARRRAFSATTASVSSLWREEKRRSPSVPFTTGPGEQLLLGAAQGLFRYDGKSVVPVEGGEKARFVEVFHDGPGEQLLLGTGDGLFRYDGKSVVPVEGGENTGSVSAFHDGPGEQLLLGTGDGLFRYDGKSVVPVEGGEKARFVEVFHDGPGEQLLLGTGDGLFRYDGKSVVPVEGGENTGSVSAFHDGPGEQLLLGTGDGLFRYDGKSVVPVEGGEKARFVEVFHDGPGEQLLLSTGDALFRYDGKSVVPVEEVEMALSVRSFHDGPGEQLLVGTAQGLFRVIYEPLSTSQIELTNGSKLREASPPPSQFGIQTFWTMRHPCTAFADRFGLHVVATNASRKDDPPVVVKHFDPVVDGTTSFEVAVPISDPGDWTFRVVSKATGATVDIGKPSEPVTFVVPGTHGILEWLAKWRGVIATIAGALWATLNLLVFVAARYSSAAWRLATDELWGKKALFLQSLLLRHWQRAQLWLLDLYVQERRKAVARNLFLFSLCLSPVLMARSPTATLFSRVLLKHATSGFKGAPAWARRRLFCIYARSILVERRIHHLRSSGVMAMCSCRLRRGASPKHPSTRRARQRGSSLASSALCRKEACLSRIEVCSARCSARERSPSLSTASMKLHAAKPLPLLQRNSRRRLCLSRHKNRESLLSKSGTCQAQLPSMSMAC